MVVLGRARGVVSEFTCLCRDYIIHHENFYIKHINSCVDWVLLIFFIFANGAEWECEFVSGYARLWALVAVLGFAHFGEPADI